MSISLETGYSVANKSRFLVFALDIPHSDSYRGRVQKNGEIQVFKNGIHHLTTDLSIRNKQVPELAHFVDIIIKYKPLVNQWSNYEGDEEGQRLIEDALHKEFAKKVNTFNLESPEVQAKYKD